MYSIAYLGVAVIDFALLLWAIQLYRKFPSTALWLAAAPLWLMWFDNLTIGLGSSLGEGQLLLAMNRIRFVSHYVLLPFLFIAIGSMAKQAGFKWAQSKLFMGGVCVIATLYIVQDLWVFAGASFYPSCFEDTLRYTTRVSESTACGSLPIVVPNPRHDFMPPAALVLTATIFAFGVLLWRKTGFKWLLLGQLLTLFFFVNPFVSGGLTGNMGEPIICAAILWAAVHVTRTYGQSE